MLSGIHERRTLPGKPVRGRHSCADPLALSPRSWPDARWPTGPGAGHPAGFAPARVPFILTSCRITSPWL